MKPQKDTKAHKKDTRSLFRVLFLVLFCVLLWLPFSSSYFFFAVSSLGTSLPPPAGYKLRYTSSVRFAISGQENCRPNASAFCFILMYVSGDFSRLVMESASF